MTEPAGSLGKTVPRSMADQAPVEASTVGRLAGDQAPAALDDPRNPGLERQLRGAAAILVSLIVVGVLGGLVWQWWSPPRPRAQVVGPGQFIQDEKEAFIASDGRFMVLMLGIGLLAGLLVWFFTSIRGPIAICALALGGIGGALVAGFVGRMTGGGVSRGAVAEVITTRLEVHMDGLYFLEAVAAVFLYCLCIAFAAEDDLGRPDPARELARAARPQGSEDPAEERRTCGPNAVSGP